MELHPLLRHRPGRCADQRQGQDLAGLCGQPRSRLAVSCLGEFATRGINLTKIESRPRRNRPWHYVFYLDFEGHWQDPTCQQALVGLLARAAFVKLLGSYPAAEIPAMNGEGGQSELLQI